MQRERKFLERDIKIETFLQELIDTYDEFQFRSLAVIRDFVTM